MMNQTNISAKTILAKLLATENLRVEHDPKASTASFDLKNRVLTCPVWEAMDGDMYDMLLSHEVSHAKNTPWEGWHTSIKAQTKKQSAYKHFLNVVEDARIEKLIKRQYPGLRRPFVNAYKALYERDLFQVKGKSTANMYFIDRVNLHCKMGFAMNIKFNAIERGLLTLVENAETWDDVVNATEKIWEYSKKEQQEDKENQKKKLQDLSESLSGEDTGEEEESEEWGDEEDSFGDEENESDEYGDSSEESDEDADSEESEDGEGTDSEDSDESNEEEDNEEESGGLKKTDGEKSEDAEEKENKEKAKPSQTGDGVDESGDDEFIPQAQTDEAFRENERQLNAKNAPAVRYINIPTPNLSQIVVDQKIVNARLSTVFNNSARSRTLLKEFQDKNQTYINSLAKEFEMKKAAKKYVKAKVAESGDINVSKLGLYRTEDDIFKRVTTLHQGKNHGLVLLLDKSGSMRNNMAGAIEQILILASFCRKVNIPFVAYGFTDPRAMSLNAMNRPKCFSTKQNDLKLGNLKLREIINSNMKAKQFTDAVMNQLSLAKAYNEYGSVALDSLPEEHLQNTPLNEALVALLPMVKQFKNAKKLDLVNLIVVHDGDADYTTYYHTNDQGSVDRFDTENERVYFRDPISGTEILGSKEAGYRAPTVAIMEMLRRVCGVGVYGFFIGTSVSDIRNYYRAEDGTDMTSRSYDDRNAKHIYTKQLYVKLTKEKFLESFTLGYDRFYMLPAGQNLKVQDQQIVINGSVTARKLATAFIKQGKAKYSNRVLVSRFIDRIAR